MHVWCWRKFCFLAWTPNQLIILSKCHRRKLGKNTCKQMSLLHFRINIACFRIPWIRWIGDFLIWQEAGWALSKTESKLNVLEYFFLFFFFADHKSSIFLPASNPARIYPASTTFLICQSCRGHTVESERCLTWNVFQVICSVTSPKIFFAGGGVWVVERTDKNLFIQDQNSRIISVAGIGKKVGAFRKG